MGDLVFRDARRELMPRSSTRMVVVAVTVAVALLVLIPAMARAQIHGGLEVARERATYHFDNPSTFDTTDLVPHFFEQRYVLDNIWFTAKSQFRLGVDLEATFGVTPVTQALATDYDTFFNPGNVVWVAGTTGDARIRSWRIGQAVRLGRTGRVVFTGGYRLRVDSADFLEGDRTEIRNGILMNRAIITTREYTTAQRHEIFVGGRLGRDLRPGWRLDLSGDVAPAAIHRLAIQLPDKYPGRTLVYRTTTLTAQGRVELTRAWTRWTMTLFAGANGTLNYDAKQRVNRTAVVGGLSIGR